MYDDPLVPVLPRLSTTIGQDFHVYDGSHIDLTTVGETMILANGSHGPSVGGLKWPTFLFLYGGIITVITAMTPETANGRGSVPLVGDGKIPGIIDFVVESTEEDIPRCRRCFEVVEAVFNCEDCAVVSLCDE